jgi:catechol 2,3-dioxygenase-like lactoylglutathione lyase family enzyme
MNEKSQERNSAVDFATNQRLHVSINVSQVARSLEFYKVLFNQAPTKVRPGYAKFEVTESPVNFTLNERADLGARGNGVNHFGIQVKSTAEVRQAKQKFQAHGLLTAEENASTCCYAVQDKVWVTDPDGNEWEVFVVLDADAPKRNNDAKDGAAMACACATPTKA